MSDLRWWPNWYATRLHAVEHDNGRSACGTYAIKPGTHEIEWRKKRIDAGLAKCKNCLRAVRVEEESDGDN